MSPDKSSTALRPVGHLSIIAVIVAIVCSGGSGANPAANIIGGGSGSGGAGAGWGTGTGPGPSPSPSPISNPSQSPSPSPSSSNDNDAGGGGSGSGSGYTGTAPNLVMILVDDMGYADTGFTYQDAATTYATPHLTSLAQDGVILSSLYANYACTPSRAAFLTGSLPFRYLSPGPPYPRSCLCPPKL